MNFVDESLKFQGGGAIFQLSNDFLFFLLKELKIILFLNGDQQQVLLYTRDPLNLKHNCELLICNLGLKSQKNCCHAHLNKFCDILFFICSIIVFKLKTKTERKKFISLAEMIFRRVFVTKNDFEIRALSFHKLFRLGERNRVDERAEKLVYKNPKEFSESFSFKNTRKKFLPLPTIS